MKICNLFRFCVFAFGLLGEARIETKALEWRGGAYSRGYLFTGRAYSRKYGTFGSILSNIILVVHGTT